LLTFHFECGLNKATGGYNNYELAFNLIAGCPTALCQSSTRDAAKCPARDAFATFTKLRPDRVKPLQMRVVPQADKT
jgi:hypothetical protein